MTALSIWFWQRMVTPHMAFLAAALAERGHRVTYVAEEPLDEQRAALGWQAPDIPDVSLRFATTAIEARELVAAAEAGTIHLTQGFRSNGTVAFAQKAIQARGQRHFVIMETVDQRGATGIFKPALYAWHLHNWRRGLNGVMAIGADTPDWLRRLAPAKLRTFPFAYFLKEPAPPSYTPTGTPFRFLFVGALVPGKRVDLLLQCLGDLPEKTFDFEVVGDGPRREHLENLAERVLPGRVNFHGVVPISEVSDHMAAADCLVLPSDHDGWGAVVSEALMTGTPVICSTACGSREVVLASGSGGVFSTFDTAALRQLLAATLAQGKIKCEGRKALRSWARCLGAAAG
jgi:glycosyltransferase involved in cell wall biosynthesis